MPARYSDDVELIAGCAKRNKKAWDTFVLRYSKLVYWSIQKTLAATTFSDRSQLVEDIFQDFFEKILTDELLAKLQDVKNLKGFVTVTACHMTMDKLKNLTRKEAKVLPMDPGAAPLNDSGAAYLLISKENGALLEEVLAGLPEREKFCVELCYLENRTHKEVGEILGLPPDTISTILRRTKEKIRDGLKEKGF